jgi:hypothetical protein
METQVKIRIYNIDYEVYYVGNPRDLEMTQEGFEEYLEELQQDIIVEIDPEDIGWNMEFITEYITDYISDITGETHNGYDYEVLVDIREVKLNLLGI